MLETTSGWSIDLDRGPDCLLIRLRPEGALCLDSAGLATSLDELLQLEFAHRIVIDLRHVPRISKQLIDELKLLFQSISEQGGLMRVCGLSNDNGQVAEALRREGRLPVYDTPEDALRGLCPGKPR